MRSPKRAGAKSPRAKSTKSPKKVAVAKNRPAARGGTSHFHALTEKEAKLQLPHTGVDGNDEAAMRRFFGAVSKLTPALRQKLPRDEPFAVLLASDMHEVPDREHRLQRVQGVKLVESSDNGKESFWVEIQDGRGTNATLSLHDGVFRWGSGNDPVYVFHR